MAQHVNLPTNNIDPKDTDRDINSWEVIMVYSKETDAYIVKGLLESEGIPAMLTNQTFSNVLPVGFNSIGGVRLWVPAEQADLALAILRRNGNN